MATSRLKPGVKFGNSLMAICFAYGIAQSIYQKYFYDFIITSVNDGKHMEGSLHYKDSAFDIRTKNIATEFEKKQIASEIKASLGEDFDVILESLGTENEHLHIEYQPK